MKAVKTIATMSLVLLALTGATSIVAEHTKLKEQLVRRVKGRQPHRFVDVAAPHVTAETAAAINANGGLWTASHEQGSLISGASLGQLRRLMGVKKSKKAGKKAVAPEAPRKTFARAPKVAIPESFDSAEQWPNCPTITHIRDQSACGSCWAVAAAEAMSDRYCTYGGPSNLLISAANLMECCWWCGNGCDGGQPNDAWAYWNVTGLLGDSCQPYPFPKCDHHTTGGEYPACPSSSYPTPACASTCSANSTATPKLYSGLSYYSLQGEQDFQQELMAHGPMEVAFSVYADFPLYKSGVYVQTSQDYLGGHAVKLVGWGVLNGTKYWKIANSWNNGWGMDGYFLIQRGVDMCGIEDAGSAGAPNLNSV